jgi:L-aspartate oxidase
MEFFQFHPTCLYHPQAKSFLVTEALRGEGALLRRPDGERFMPHHHPLAELAPRDVVARAIDSEMKEHGFDCVYLDISHREPEWIRARFPTVHRHCLEYGFDLATQPVPVVPAAHYQCGGIVTDLQARTSIGRLYAAGEVACTGLHGANRLASNSLLEALVFGHRAAAHIVALLAADASPPPVAAPWDTGAATTSTESVVVSQDWDEIRRFMWNYVGIVRSDQRLERARKRITLLQDEIHAYYWNVLPSSDLIELRNIATVAELIITCASHRHESRGLHTTSDHPEALASERRDTVIQRGSSRAPIPLAPGAWR